MSESDQRLWGDETEKAVANFPVSGHPVPAPVIQWLGRLKAAAARTNADLGLLEAELAELGTNAHGTADSVADHTNREYAIRFPWDPDSALVKRWKKAYQVDSNITADSKLVQAADLFTE